MEQRSLSQLSSSDDQETVRIVSEHLQWKKTIPVLYDIFAYERLEGPSFFVQWLPGGVNACAGDPSHTLQNVLLGTRSESDLACAMAQQRDNAYRLAFIFHQSPKNHGHIHSQSSSTVCPTRVRLVGAVQMDKI